MLDLVIRTASPEHGALELPLRVAGELGLPRGPGPSPVLQTTPAAFAVLELDQYQQMPPLLRMFSAWYWRQRAMTVVVGDGRGTWVTGRWKCIDFEIHEGVQSLYAGALPPHKWRIDEWGTRVPYRDQPTLQRIVNPVHRYVLGTWQYELCGPPPQPVVPAQVVLQ